jgi:hypothetical protein
MLITIVVVVVVVVVIVIITTTTTTPTTKMLPEPVGAQLQERPLRKLLQYFRGLSSMSDRGSKYRSASSPGQPEITASKRR